MKPLREVALAYMALAEAERQILDGSNDAAADSCRKAMETSRTIPAEEAFDHEGFDAFCHARLSEALSRLGHFEECLGSADKALYYFNRRGELNQENGKLWITAVFSRALALEALGRNADALAEFRKAGEMLEERKGDMPGKEMLRSIAVSRTIQIQAGLKKEKTSGYKAWWEFWS